MIDNTYQVSDRHTSLVEKKPQSLFGSDIVTICINQVTSAKNTFCDVVYPRAMGMLLRQKKEAFARTLSIESFAFDEYSASFETLLIPVIYRLCNRLSRLLSNPRDRQHVPLRSGFGLNEKLRFVSLRQKRIEAFPLMSMLVIPKVSALFLIFFLTIR